MIIVFAGSQAAAADGSDAGDVRRLTPEQLEDVRARVRRLLLRVRPSLVVGAAASGVDLVVLETAAAEGIRRRVVLPFDRATFRATSVDPKGDAWTQSYERVLQELLRTDPASIEEGAADPADADVYRTHNGVLLDRARDLAKPGERVWVLVVRPPGTTSSVTDDLAARAEGQGLLVVDLDPTRPLQARPTAFVAMPYGKKFDPVSRRKVDCDPLFDRVYVPVLEDLDVEWLRADLDTDTGIIHVGMIEALANSDVVIADLATLNANVAYELGVRHALAPHATVLVAPHLVEVARSFPMPFDVGPIRAVPIKRSFTLTDEQAEAGVRSLKAVLSDALAARRDDSPVASWFEYPPVRPLVRRAEMAQALEREAKLRNLVDHAARSALPTMIQEAIEAVASANVSEAVRISMRLQLAKTLQDDGRYEEARELLSMAEPDSADPRRLTWLHQEVMVLRRLGERAREAGDTGFAYWDQAEELLNEAMAFGDREETLGIVAGLVKRRLMVALEEKDPARAPGLLARLTDLYGRAFEAEPSYYGGVNLLAALRLKGQHYGQDASALARARELSPVVKFFAEREYRVDPDDLWPIATLGEIALHDALLRQLPAMDLADATTWYGRLAGPKSADVRRSAASQLRFFVLSGDPAEPLEKLIDLLEAP